MIITEKLIPTDAETPITSELTYTDEQLSTFSNYIYDEIEDAHSQRKSQEATWIQALRDYEAQPKSEIVNIPIENAPNIVVPLCAIAAESIYAIAVDLIFGTSPTLTIRSPDNEVRKAIQTLVDKLAATADVNLRNAVEHAILDCVLPGTAFLYVPWIESTKKTDINRVKFFGPRIYAIPPEDILTRGGSTDDIEMLPWIAYRTYPTHHELEQRAKALGWDIEGNITAVGNIDQVRAAREALARSNQSGIRQQKIYEIYDFYCTYDLDGDGEFEDLLAFYDRTSRKVLAVRYNPYERRPFRKMCYQIRAHQFNGMGVPEMLRHLQSEITQIHNSKILNMLLANTRMWVSKHGTFATGNVRVWPNRNIEVSDTNDFKEIKLSDIYPSAMINEANDLQLAERRVGSELPMPRPSQIMSSRTPATTTMTLLQQVNRRFTPAFDQMRQCVSGAMKHCLFRIQEQLLAGNVDAKAWIITLIGEEMGNTAINTLKNVRFDDEVSVELTASSATVNRDADKQEILTLVDRLSLYYEKILQLAAIISNPATPPLVAQVAQKIAEKAAEVLDRVLRTFDSVRDPESIIVKMDEMMDQGLPNLPPEILMALQQSMGGGGMMPGGGAGGMPGMPGLPMPGGEGGAGATANGAADDGGEASVEMEKQ